jgi:hypothetical protein
VRYSVSGRFRIEKTRRRLAQQAGRKSNHTLGTRQPREHSRFQESLQVERGVVARSPQIADDREQRAGFARMDTDPPIDHRNQLEQISMARVNEPVNGGLRKRTSNRGRRRNGMDDVAERAELDDEKS